MEVGPDTSSGPLIHFELERARCARPRTRNRFLRASDYYATHPLSLASSSFESSSVTLRRASDSAGDVPTVQTCLTEIDTDITDYQCGQSDCDVRDGEDATLDAVSRECLAGVMEDHCFYPRACKWPSGRSKVSLDKLMRRADLKCMKRHLALT